MAEKKNLTTQPALIGNKVYLRPATAEDVANTYHWFLLGDPSSMTCRPLTVNTAAESAEAYKKAERSPDRQLFMVVRKKDNVPVGQIRFFDLNNLNRSAELGLLVDPDEQKKGVGSEAVKILCEYLFATRGLNKVYAQTGSFNAGAKALLESADFKLDGTLRRHYFYKGEYHDGLIYSLLAYEFGR